MAKPFVGQKVKCPRLGTKLECPAVSCFPFYLKKLAAIKLQIVFALYQVQDV